MDRVFSMDEVSEHSWSSEQQPKMIRSSSEWAFQRFLQEAEEATTTTEDRNDPNDVVEIKPNDDKVDDRGNDDDADDDVNGDNDTNDYKRAPPGRPPTIDSEEYQAFLKSQLELACAAVALSWSGNSNVQERALAPSEKEPHPVYKANVLDKSKPQAKDVVGSVRVPPPLPSASKKHLVQVKSTTSGSSGEQSDDDEVEGENEFSQNMDPADAKRMRRMLSNRESARRSRKRKQAHLTELETQVSQLRVENSSLLKRLTDISRKYNEAAVDNRVLKADAETLKAKVKMAEDTVKRVTGLNNPLFQAMSELSSSMMADAAVPVQDDPNRNCHHAQSNNNKNNRNQLSTQNYIIQENEQANAAATSNKMGRSVSMQRVASLEHLQKRIRGEMSTKEK